MDEPPKSAINHIAEILASLPSELPADHPLFAPIGRVASEWAHFEHTLDTCIWELADLPHETGACITAQIMGSTNRLRSIISLAANAGISEDTIVSAKALMNKSYDVQEARNRLIHDPWLWIIRSGGAGQFRSMPHKTGEFGFTEVTVDYILTVIERIRRRRATADALRRDIYAELYSLRGRFPSLPPEALPPEGA